MKRYGLLILAVMFMIGAIGKPLRALEVQSSFSSYTSPVAPLQIDIPVSWKVENPPKTPNPYLIFFASSPEAGIEILLEHTDFKSLSEFREKVRADITIFPQVILLAEGKTTIAELPGYWFDYSFPTQDDTVRARLYLFSRNDAFFRIICLTSQENFYNFLSTFEHIVQSLRFVPMQNP